MYKFYKNQITDDLFIGLAIRPFKRDHAIDYLNLIIFSEVCRLKYKNIYLFNDVFKTFIRKEIS